MTKTKMAATSVDLHGGFMSLEPVAKTRMYDLCLDMLADCPGLFLEFGVWQGGSINYLARQLPYKKFYGFDSFEGLPEDWHLSDKDSRMKGHFATKIPHVRKNVELVKGFFDKSLPPFIDTHPGKVCFLHIDSDLYSSAKFVLDSLNHRIDVGTIIVFDEICDWSAEQKYYPLWPEGEWKALIEWLAEYGREVTPIYRNHDMRGAVRVVK